MLKKEALQFKTETEVWKEALNTLGSESSASNNMSSTDFRIVEQNSWMWIDFRMEGW